MYKNLVMKPLVTAALSFTIALAPAWAQLPDQNSGGEKTLTGTVSDSFCKGRHNRKAQTQFSCTLKCTHEEGADYVLVTDEAVYVLEGQRPELDRFAGGHATVTGQVSNNRVTVDSVTR